MHMISEDFQEFCKIILQFQGWRISITYKKSVKSFLILWNFNGFQQDFPQTHTWF